MASKAGTLEILAQQIALALQPLETQLTAANIIPFLAELGLQFPPQIQTLLKICLSLLVPCMGQGNVAEKVEGLGYTRSISQLPLCL